MRSRFKHTVRRCKELTKS